MLGKNHLVLGAIAGVSTALAMNVTRTDINLGYIFGATVLGATLPDVDMPFTIAGTIFLPISFVLYKIFGHRGFVHSPLFWAIIGTGFYAFLPFEIFIALMVGITTHLVADFFTKGGIPFLYPFIKDRQAFWDKKTGTFGEMFVAIGLGLVYTVALDAYVPFIETFFNMV